MYSFNLRYVAPPQHQDLFNSTFMVLVSGCIDFVDTCIYMNACAYVYRGQRLFFTKLSWNQNLMDLSRLADLGVEAPGILLSLPAQCWD